MSQRLRVGMGPPYAVQISTVAGPDFDPEDPTSATFNVTKPSGETVTWTAAITTQNATKIVTRYALAAPGAGLGDLDERGVWKLWVSFGTAVPGDSLRTEVVTFKVAAADQQ
jgi:hypothetical protein